MTRVTNRATEKDAHMHIKISKYPIIVRYIRKLTQAHLPTLIPRQE